MFDPKIGVDSYLFSVANSAIFHKIILKFKQTPSDKRKLKIYAVDLAF